MGNPLFGIDIAGIVAEALGDGLLPVTITRGARGARTAGNLTGGRAVIPEAVSCIGFWDDVDRSVPPGIEIELNDRVAVLIGDSIPAGGQPLRNDLITVHEDIGDLSLYVVQLISRDPAAALYRYLCRDRRGPDSV